MYYLILVKDRHPSHWSIFTGQILYTMEDICWTILIEPYSLRDLLYYLLGTVVVDRMMLQLFHMINQVTILRQKNFSIKL